tara:strand:- start:449 stop:607 length:159 start_codon:yes stop_codon:yes gene_type:complete
MLSKKEIQTKGQEERYLYEIYEYICPECHGFGTLEHKIDDEVYEYSCKKCKE